MSTTTDAKTIEAVSDDGTVLQIPTWAKRMWLDDVEFSDEAPSLAAWYVRAAAEQLEEDGDEPWPEPVTISKPHRDPRCDHSTERALRVQSPPKGDPEASVWVCHRNACLLDAASWATEFTGQPCAVIGKDRARLRIALMAEEEALERYPQKETTL